VIKAIKAIESIYIAGKMENEWRIGLFDEYDPTNDHAHQWGCNPITIEHGDAWPEHSHMHVCGLRYTGPFFVELCGGHGFSYFEGEEHGGNNGHPSHCATLEDRRQEVQQWCLQAIAKADLVLAWIDCIDCYGTIAEIGYAKALGKIIWIAGPTRYDDLWFVYQMGDIVDFFYGGESLREIIAGRIHDFQQLHRHFDSPIEQAFWDGWFSTTQNAGNFELTPQHPIGKYRVDFAHIKTKTAIELDGHATHSSPDAIAYDRKRQREIEKEGWHVIRFGGKEITSKVGFCIDEAWMLLSKRMEGAG